jgi:hypothetical protein
LPSREIANAIFDLMLSGWSWTLLPTDLRPWNTVCRWYASWRDVGVSEGTYQALATVDRERVVHKASLSSTIIDGHLEPHSASVRDCDSGGPLRASRAAYPIIACVFASGFNHQRTCRGYDIVVEIVRILPIRLALRYGAGAWSSGPLRGFGRNCRRALDFEATIDRMRAKLKAIKMELRHGLARRAHYGPCSPYRSGLQKFRKPALS